MIQSRSRRIWLGLALASLLASVGAGCWLAFRDPGDPRLNGFVHSRPPAPIVFTSRSETASFSASAPEGEVYTVPGARPWAAREGRLRILTERGTVRELTWNKPLPDGGTLIDVMSPTISLDGKRVLFAGRRGDGHGRFRLYEVEVDGGGLRQLTGLGEDPGCIALPPLRWNADGGSLSNLDRITTDYDDVDPVELNFSDRRIAFVSSRDPDLGRDHARRSTNLWLLHADGRKQRLTANRNNDRWPFLLSSGYLAFSLQSRNREVISADRTDITPYSSETPRATEPADNWLGAFTQIPGGHFGMLVKPRLPVWRPRPLFANRVAFMSSERDGAPLTIVQAEPGLIEHAPSATPIGQTLPNIKAGGLRFGPNRDRDGNSLWSATPSPCPNEHVVFAGAITQASSAPMAGGYGLYIARHDWPDNGEPADPAVIDLKVLFDDPELADAEPVAVYQRKLPLNDGIGSSPSATAPADLLLANGHNYRGPMGQLFATGLDVPTPMRNLPGQTTDAGAGPIFDAPPAGAIDHLRIYAARRDRFDDPKTPRILGKWELLLKIPVKNGVAAGWIPAGTPTVLAGFDQAGRVVQWTTPAKDRAGRQATMFAYAGDHYSLAQPQGKHFCVGCHPGHSGLSPDSHRHAESLK